MSTPQQQFIATGKANLDNLVAAQNRMFAGFEALIDLNLNVFKSSLENLAEKSQQVASLKNPEQASSFATTLLQPSAESALNYSQQVFDIIAGLQRDLGNLTEAQINQNQEQVSQLIEQAEKNAPAGSESLFAVLKTAVLNSTHVADSMIKAGRQVSDVVDSNITAARNTAVKATEKAAEAVEKTVGRATRTTSTSA